MAIVDERGEPLRDGDRTVCVRYPDTVSGRVMRRAQMRAFRRRLSEGTLDETVNRTSKDVGNWVVVGIACFLAALCVALWWLVVQQYLAIAPGHRTLADLIVLPLMALVPTLGSAAAVWWLARWEPPSCNAFRLNADNVTPLDGPQNGVPLARPAITSHSRHGPHVRLVSGDRVLRLEWPSRTFELWMGIEEAERERQRRGMRRSLWWLAIGGVIATTSSVALSAGQPLSQQLKPLNALVPLALVGWVIHSASQGWEGPQFLHKLDNRLERKRRKRARETSGQV